jgi:hypothetical protein
LELASEVVAEVTTTSADGQNAIIFLSDRRLAGKENAGKENERLYGKGISGTVR